MQSSSSGLLPFSVATLCFIVTRGTSRCTTSFAVKKVKR